MKYTDQDMCRAYQRIGFHRGVLVASAVWGVVVILVGLI